MTRLDVAIAVILAAPAAGAQRGFGSGSDIGTGFGSRSTVEAEPPIWTETCVQGTEGTAAVVRRARGTIPGHAGQEERGGRADAGPSVLHIWRPRTEGGVRSLGNGGPKAIEGNHVTISDERGDVTFEGPTRPAQPDAFG